MKPAQSIRIRHDLLGAGWANAALIVDGTVTIVSGSNRSDALGDLVTAARLLAEGEADARCAWEGERHETRWIFNWRSDGLRLRILEFSLNERFWDDKDGRIRVDVILPRLEVTRAVLLAADEILYHHGAAGYRAEGVTHPFPTTALERLRSALPASEAAA